MKYACFFLFLLSAAVVPAAAQTPAPVCNVASYGARGDRQTKDTTAIQKAIDACARAGGGVVWFPAGNFLSGTLTLRANITLRLAPGATLWGSRALADYHPPHLIYAQDADHIAIEGGGAINGQGEAFWDASFRPLPRPSALIELVRCRHVRIENISIRSSPEWTIHPKDCDGVQIRGISIVNPMRGPNTDGIDPDSSRNVRISDSYIEAGDDCIVLKTTSRGGPVRPCENVTVTNCVLISDDTALKLGTESYANIQHCVFSNCIIRRTRVGIGFYAKDGGVFQDISFSNIGIETFPTHPDKITWPIFLDLEKRKPDSRLSAIRDVSFSGLRIETQGRILVEGMPERPLENLSFRNIVMRITGFERVEGVSKPRGSSEVGPPRVDYGPTPSALIFAGVRGLDLRDIRVLWDTTESPPERHAIYAANVDGLRIDGFTGRQAAPRGQLAAIEIDHCRNVFVTGSQAGPGTGAFVHLTGTPAGEVLLQSNDLRHSARTHSP